MKQLFIILFSFVFIVELQSQNNTGKVIDSENSFVLSKVIIQNISGTFSTSTNTNGSFYLPKKGTYIFSKKGYKSKIISISVDAYSIIKLAVTRESLKEVIITSNNFRSKLSTLPSAVSVLTSENIKNNNLINTAPILNLVPGVFMHNGTLTTNRITIRGIGSRNLYGTNKIRAYYQDIPLTNGSGASTIEDIEISTLGHIEILKGPSSSIYGAGLGGTIQLIPDKGVFEETSLSSNFTFGSYGLQKHLLQLNISNSKNTAKVSYSNIHTDGYRLNNKTDRQSLTLASQHFISDSDKLTFVGNFIDLKAFIPSSINEEGYLNSPTSAAFTWERAKGYEEYKKGFVGLSWEHDYSIKTKQFTSVFTSFVDSNEPRPFNVLKERTNGLGLRSRISSNITAFNKSLKWTLGGEVFHDTNSNKTYENLYNDFPPEVGSVKGVLLSNFKEKRKYFNLFFDSKYELSKTTIASFGLNFNYTSYTLNDFFTSDVVDYSGKYNFGTILSPKFGLMHQVAKKAMIYTTVSHGFSPPTLEETLLPDGLINTNIKPESGWNFEIGSRGWLFNNKLLFDFAIYTMHVKNLLVARRTGNDEFIGVNAGKTKYNGLELTLNYHLVNSENLKIYHTNAYAYNDFKFKTFVDDDNNYSGNDLTGVPNLTFNSNLNFESNIGIYAFLSYNMIGEIPMRDDNSVYSKKYQLVNCKIGFKSNESKKIQFNVFVGINNLFNEKYASMLLINAGSFGGNAPRYYYPGEPTNYYSGVNLKYVF